MVLQYVLEMAKYKPHLSIFKGNIDLAIKLFPCKYQFVGALSNWDYSGATHSNITEKWVWQVNPDTYLYIPYYLFF